MSVIGHAGVRLTGAVALRRLCAVSQTNMTREISWMAFEMPDPALYQSPPSLQPKRPVAADAVPNADGTSPSAQPITMAGRVGSPPAAVASSQGSASGKVIPASVPASAMRTGPVPLSQIQKRTFASSDSTNLEPATSRPTTPQQGRETPAYPHFPTLQVRIPGHPATWPVQQHEERSHGVYSGSPFFRRLNQGAEDEDDW